MALAFALTATVSRSLLPVARGSLLSSRRAGTARSGLDPSWRREYAIPVVGDGPIDPLSVPSGRDREPGEIARALPRAVEARNPGGGVAQEWERDEPDLSASVA